MNLLAAALSGLLLITAAVVRASLASLVRTPRADALHDAPDFAGARVAADLLEDRASLQPSIGVVNAALLISATIPAAWAVTTAGIEGLALVGALVAIGLVILFFGDAAPRAFGRARPRRLAYRFAWLLRIAYSVGAAANDLVDDDDESDLDDDHDEDDHQEIELISSVLDFSETILREVMVPRTDMVSIPFDRTSEHALDAVIAHGYSRIPVTGDGSDDIKGIVYAKDLLKLMNEGASPVAVSEMLRPAYFVPETKKISDMLRDMQTNQVHMAVVVNEFGGTAGLVTIEDLLEELVGEIADEYDSEEPMVITGIDGSLLVDGRLDVDELSELVGAELPDEEWDTVGGLVLGLAGRVPKEGESYSVGPITINVVRVQGRRVAKVRVTQVDAGAASQNEAS